MQKDLERWKWRSIETGLYKNQATMYEILQSKNMLRFAPMGSYLKSFLIKEPITLLYGSLELFRVPQSELCFNSDFSDYSQIEKVTQKYGLCRCPHEVGSLLRLQYLNQPQGENLLIAMDPFHTMAEYHSDEHAYDHNEWSWYCVACDQNGPYLNYITRGPGGRFDKKSIWIFCANPGALM